MQPEASTAKNLSYSQSAESPTVQNNIIGYTIKHCPGIEHFFSKKIPAWKRGLDIFGSITGLIILSPLFILVSLIIKTMSPGPVLFKQERIGYGGKPFILYKFRTMKINTDPSKHKQYLADLINEHGNDICSMTKLDHEDPNIIPMGRILRNTCIDELPQIINVFLGNMSLVGPRPAIDYEVDHYLRWHSGRFDAMPGMTGLWQVGGKNNLSFREMVRLDIRYCKNMSFLGDLKIIFKTPIAIIFIMMQSRSTEKYFLKGAK